MSTVGTQGGDPRRRAAILLGLSAASASLIASCGVPSESNFEPIEAPFVVGATTTTATTVRTTGPVGSLTTTTARAAPRPSSTLVSTEPVLVYFVEGDRLVERTVTIVRPASPTAVAVALAAGPPEAPSTTTSATESDVPLETLITPELVMSITVADGVATVDLRGDELRQFDVGDQTLVLAQLVLSLGQRPGIGQVAFAIDAAPMAVPIPDELELSEPGEAVSRDDYESLLGTAGTSPPSTPPSSTMTPTNLPADE